MGHRRLRRRARHAGTWVAVLASASLLACSAAQAGGVRGITQLGARGGIAPAGSPYRWQAVWPGGAPGITVVERIRRPGGEVERTWLLKGRWYLAAPAYDRRGAGLSDDEGTLVLTRLAPETHGPRRRTRLAILDPRSPRRDAVRHLTLPGVAGVYALSPDGDTLFLTRTRFGRHGRVRFTIQPYDLRHGRLLPARAIGGNGEILSGLATARIQDRRGRHVYTLYMDPARRGGTRIYVLALDTVARGLAKAEPPQLRGRRNPLLLGLHLGRAGHFLAITAPSRRGREGRERGIVRIDLRRLPHPRPPRRATGAVGSFDHVVGHSLAGRPIELRSVGDLALPGAMLVFGCIHGDECGASALEPLQNGCPDPDLHAYLVPNLDPDGSAAKTRLNARGVDLNRNFPTAWRPIGDPGSPEYSGPRPFSEPESRLAARLIRRLAPHLTIWFHQHWGSGSFVRAWGQSVPAARRFAALAGIDFRLMPWLAGTAPHWQNRRFPGTASFVVELPRGKLAQRLRMRLVAALSRLGEEVGHDPDATRRR